MFSIANPFWFVASAKLDVYVESRRNLKIAETGSAKEEFVQLTLQFSDNYDADMRESAAYALLGLLNLCFNKRENGYINCYSFKKDNIKGSKFVIEFCSTELNFLWNFVSVLNGFFNKNANNQNVGIIDKGFFYGNIIDMCSFGASKNEFFNKIREDVFEHFKNEESVFKDFLKQDVNTKDFISNLSKNSLIVINNFILDKFDSKISSASVLKNKEKNNNSVTDFKNFDVNTLIKLLNECALKKCFDKLSNVKNADSDEGDKFCKNFLGNKRLTPEVDNAKVCDGGSFSNKKVKTNSKNDDGLICIGILNNFEDIDAKKTNEIKDPYAKIASVLKDMVSEDKLFYIFDYLLNY